MNNQNSFVKQKKVLVKPKKNFIRSEKYYFMSILTDFTKFLLEAIEYMGVINSQLNEIDKILTKHSKMNLYIDDFTKDELYSNVYSFQNSVNNFTNNFHTDQSKSFYLMTTSSRLHKELYDFKYEPEKIDKNINIKDTFEKLITHNINVSTIKIANNYKNSKIDLANSLINSNTFNFDRFKKVYNLEANELMNNLYKEVIDIQVSLLNKKSDLSSEINKLIEDLKELFIDTEESPKLAENILDINLVKKRKDAIKTILRQ